MSENLTAMVRFLRDQMLRLMTLNECTLEFSLDMMQRKLPMDLDQAYEVARSPKARGAVESEPNFR
jgi:hypothetical protein